MKKNLVKELEAIKKRERKVLEAEARNNRFKQTLYEKIPASLRETLEAAFAKAFKLVFLKGAQVIEKTFDKETANLNYEAGNYVVDKAGSRKSIKRLDKGARKGNLLNNTATTISGFGMGILGFGLPDIPLMVSTLLKGVYEIALGYGFEYETKEEQIYILRLVRTALSTGEEKRENNQQLENTDYASISLDDEIELTAKVLSDSLLVEKFVQGIPIVGVIGGIVNFAAYTKTSALAGIKYKKRYLIRKLKDGSGPESGCD